ncbi:hypothetical protein [Segatella copri]|uniref:hypothetical protein n=1 Tax=Segatella copri TaxID=165179 RepID=UPI0012926313|nr:hypothetical protein [Segatella copri]MQM89509.1 hypothetical protein [Segatella copri]MQM97298.1 hypothetical protein [Segatella copri]MQN02443.1 hypothetical protein [Segatella copri]MQN16321.1 hypothetical protein [Segatella copri]MQN19033.1 hypothetical protein [Segatella copri]
MAENTELQLVQQQANNITRQIATLKSDTENAVQANRKSYEACVQAGESLLSDISASGMNDALDEKAAEFIKKAKLTEKAMTEKRKGVTQVFDIVRKGFTMMESLISAKNTDSVVYKIQEKRNEYAAYKLEQQRKAEQERLRQERIKEAKIKLKTDTIDTLNNLLTEHSSAAINSLNNTFSLLTLDNKDEVKKRITECSDVLDLGHLFVNNKPSYSSEIEENDAKDIMNGAYKEISASLLASYKQTVTATRDELLMKFDSKIAELLEIKKAEEERKRKEEEARKAAEEERKKQEEIQRIKDEEERKRKEAELKAAEEERKRKEAEAAAAEAERKAKEEAIRKADEAAKEEQQRKLAAEQEKRDAENAAQHATAQAQSLFAQTSVGNTSKQKIKVTKRLVVTDKNAWLDIIQQWWTIEGSFMSPDKLASKLEFMRKACEKHANNEEEYIVSPYIKYEDEVTAK